MAAVATNLVTSIEATPPRMAPREAIQPALAGPPIETQAATESADPEPPEPESDGPALFTLQIGASYGHHHEPGSEVRVIGAPLSLAFYGQLTAWAAIGIRLRGGIAPSSMGLVGGGLLGVPSLMLTLREQLTPTLGIRGGVHVEGGLNFYGSNFDTWSFGLGVGAYVMLEVGPHMGFQLDYDINMYGFGERGSFFDGMGTLSYVHRFR